ncbi:unnamed protein product [[Actinomadura] parvosata subsp. kistnae]|nr:unnamed protein product [Actinomadura parvosata subsp. kistnae]
MCPALLASSRTHNAATKHGRGHRRAAESPVGVIAGIDVKPRLMGRRPPEPTPLLPRSIRPSFTGMAIRAARSNSSLPSRLCVEQVTSKQTRPQACLTGLHLPVQTGVTHWHGNRPLQGGIPRHVARARWPCTVHGRAAPGISAPGTPRTPAPRTPSPRTPSPRTSTPRTSTPRTSTPGTSAPSTSASGMSALGTSALAM